MEPPQYNIKLLKRQWLFEQLKPNGRKIRINSANGAESCRGIIRVFLSTIIYFQRPLLFHIPRNKRKIGKIQHSSLRSGKNPKLECFYQPNRTRNGILHSHKCLDSCCKNKGLFFLGGIWPLIVQCIVWGCINYSCRLDSALCSTWRWRHSTRSWFPRAPAGVSLNWSPDSGLRFNLFRDCSVRLSSFFNRPSLFRPTYRDLINLMKI